MKEHRDGIGRLPEFDWRAQKVDVIQMSSSWFWGIHGLLGKSSGVGTRLLIFPEVFIKFFRFGL
jgi:hypothetical protein